MTQEATQDFPVAEVFDKSISDTQPVEKSLVPEPLQPVKVTLPEVDIEGNPVRPKVDNEAMEGVSDYIAITEDNGLKKRIISEGIGRRPPYGSLVHVHYVGTLFPSGEKFDSSRDRDEPFKFKIGVGQVIKGWDKGVRTMRIGEKAELICSPEYAYGANGSPPKIPANATLKFEVELLDIEEQGGSVEGRIQHAQRYKGEGTELLQRDSDYIGALKAYAKGIRTVEDLYGVDEEKDKTLMIQLRVSMRLNMALCHLKTQQYKDVVMDCEKVLDDEPENVKALYRLGVARKLMGEFDEARKQLAHAAQLAPNDAAIRQEILAVNQAEQQYRSREKAMFSKMFA